MRSLVCCPLCICKSYLVSRLLSVANTLVQRSKTLAQRCKHACAAFQNACSALHTRLFSVANPLVQRYRTLVQRCRRLCSAPHLHSLLTEGSAAWAVALKSGRRPMAQAVRALAGGLRLVTEGYSGVPPLPPTWGLLGVTSGSPPTHQNPCNLRCFLCMVLKNIVFYGVSWPPRCSGISSWRYQKTTRFTWFWRSGGAPERKKWHVEGVLT